MTPVPEAQRSGIYPTAGRLRCAMQSASLAPGPGPIGRDGAERHDGVRPGLGRTAVHQVAGRIPKPEAYP